ncbi:MAG: para-aminobenzoate synthase glutamine amidotransferase component II [Osedax symbiont Rs2]|nr:MAG: para-aminobenzoate synthase glutamine amidotransferase component II [Osedax symbiont Rs2]
MRVLIIDNYDSFTFNLYQYVGDILSRELSGQPFEVIVKRNDALNIQQISQLAPDRIIISPGPGTPEDPAYFGICAQVIKQLGTTIPTLGVCLGMQGIAHVFGASIIHASVPVHGKVSPVLHDGQGVYQNMPQQLEIMRYHSLMVDVNTLPDCLQITSVVDDVYARDSDNFSRSAQRGSEIMGIRHREYPIEGIQYHPESFATEGGKLLLKNFLLH